MKEFLRLLAAEGWVPHPGQEAYLRSTARFRVLACGRRWGKTDAAAADISARIFSRQKSRQLAIAPTVAQARIVFERVVWMLTAAGLIFTPTLTPHPSIKIPDGTGKATPALHVLDARSGHQAKFLRGQGADHILIDEAAYLPETLIADTAMPMLATTGGGMTLISTPKGRNHFYRYFLRGECGENEFWSRSGVSAENPAVDADYVEMQRELLTDHAFRTEYMAEFCDSSATVFGYEFLEAALSTPPVDSGRVVVGTDWARKRDNTAVVAVRGNKNRAEVIACEAWNKTSWSLSMQRVLEFAEKHKSSLIVGDATGIGDMVQESMRRLTKTIPVKNFVFTQKSKGAAITNLIWMFERGRLRLPVDVELFNELESYEQKQTEFNTTYAAGSGHDDRVCALAIACAELSGEANARIIGRERNK